MTETFDTKHSAPLDASAVRALSHRVQEEIDSGRLLAAQYSLGINGDVRTFESFGTATDDHRFVIFSATKPIVAAAIVALVADDKIDVTKRVGDYIPEFASNAKSEVTVEQVMLMQGGFPQALIGPEQWGTSAGRRAAFAKWTLDWPSGTRCEYHPVSAHWVLAELIETLSQRPYAAAIHEMVTLSAGVAMLLGPEMADHASVVEVRMRGARPGDDVLLLTYGSSELIPDVSIGAEALLTMNNPLAWAAGIPGGGAVARADDVALLYQAWLRDPRLSDAIGNIRNNLLNESSKYLAHRTLLFEVAGADNDTARRWFPADRPRVFGHHGAGGQLCWADPDTGLSFCFLHDTLDQDPAAEVRRSSDINELAAACLAS